MRRLFLTAFLSACAFTVTASAQPAPNTPPPYDRNRTSGDIFWDKFVTPSGLPNLDQPVKNKSKNKKRSLEGLIVQVSLNESLLVVEQTGSGRRYDVPLNALTKLKAEGGTELSGRTDLKVDDLKPGQPVKVIYSVPGPQVHEVRLRRKKS